MRSRTLNLFDNLQNRSMISNTSGGRTWCEHNFLELEETQYLALSYAVHESILTLSKEDGMAICKYSALEGDMPTFPMDEKYITF